MHIPKKLDFGLALIQVRFVSIKEMKELQDWEEGDPVADGMWDPDEDTIFIRKRLPPQLRRDVYWHEIKHCVNDTDYWSRRG